MKILTHLCAALLLLAPTLSTGQNSYNDGLKILSPRYANNYKVPASFDTISMKITPMGTYANVDITMEVSAKNSNLQNSNDSLEIEYKFSLPTGSHIHAAWLWMNNIPVLAALYEKKRAQFIYESLVSRRVDPLIIYKTDNDSYEARIFPVWNNDSRKVKFSLLIPIKANSKSIELPLPLSMFRSDIASNKPYIHIDIANNSFWGTPTVFESGASSFVSGNSTHILLQSTHTNLFSNYSIFFDQRTEDNVFITSEESGTDGYFQLFLSPKDTMPGRHFLFAVDYVLSNDVSYAEIQSILKSKLKFELTEKDSFNIIYNRNAQVVMAWNQWMPATTANITLGLLDFTTISNSTKLNFEVISKAIQFNNEQANKGNILVISNANTQFNNANTCNTKINELLNAMPVGNLYPINIAQIATTRQVDFWAPGTNSAFYNNEYLLMNLASVTGGLYSKRLLDPIDYYTSSFRSLGNVLGTAVDQMMPKTLFDEVNYSYPGLITNDYPLGHPVYSNQRDTRMITGRYFGGGGNIILQRHYNANGNIYQHNFTLQPTDDPSMLTRKIWAGKFLEELIGNNSTGTYSAEIVNESIHYQVLTPYTAFLALEPDTLPKMVSNNAVSIKEQAEGAFDMVAVPNPFRELQQIKVSLTPELNDQDWECIVTDITGKVLSVQKGKTGSNNALIISWNGSSLSAGIYLVKVNIGGKKSMLKVVKQE